MMLSNAKNEEDRQVEVAREIMRGLRPCVHPDVEVERYANPEVHPGVEFYADSTVTSSAFYCAIPFHIRRN